MKNLCLAIMLLLSPAFLGCGVSHYELMDTISMLHAQNIQLKEQATEYAALMAQNQVALGNLIQQHNAIVEAAIAETCTPRAF